MQALLSSSPASSSSSSAALGFASSLHRRRPSSSPLSLGARSSKGLASSKWVSSFLPSSWRSSSACRSLVTPVVLCKVPNITQDSFPDEVLKSDSPVLVGFCADWCGPCKLIGPVIDSVAKVLSRGSACFVVEVSDFCRMGEVESTGFLLQDFSGSLKAVKIDVDTSPDLVKEYDVYGLPTLILFKDGKEVPKSRREGAINAKKLKALLDEVLPTVASP